MLISKEDAATRWCPFVRSPQAAPVGSRLELVGGCNTQDNGSRPDRTSCIASGCMAWRWAGWRTKTFGTIAPLPSEDNKDGPRLGYCGLAGKPFEVL